MKLFNAVINNNLELVKKLIKEGHTLNDKSGGDWTALILASWHGHIEIVKELIKAGVSLNDKNESGNTALIYASHRGYVEIMKELIKAGASLTETDSNGDTALVYNKKIFISYDIQDLILKMYPDKYSFLEENVGIHKDILLRLKMEQILHI